MANEYYNASGYPASHAPGVSASLRSELANVGSGFDKLPTLTGNANRLVSVNNAGTALFANTAVSLTAAGAISGLTDVTVGGVLTASAGSAALPSITFAGDTNTGVFQVGADQLGLTAGGVHQATIGTSGLIVVGSAGSYTFRVIDRAGSGDRVRIATLASGSGALIDVTDNGETTTARTLTLGASNGNTDLGSSSQFRKDTAGRVLINGAPSLGGAWLLVKTGTARNIGFYDSTSVATLAAFNDTGVSIALKVAGQQVALSGDGGTTNSVLVDSNNNVVIGTSSATQRLRVLSSLADYTAKIENTRGDATGFGLWVDTRWNVSSNIVARFSTNSGANEILNLYGDSNAVFSGNVGIGATPSGFRLDFGTSGAGTVGGVANIAGYSNSGAYTIWGGRGTVDGGYLQVYGSTHATQAGSVIIGSSNVPTVFVNVGRTVGIGIQPSATWRTGAFAFQAGVFATLHTASNGATTLGFGAIETGTNTYSYSTTGDTPAMYQQITGQHIWYQASGSGTAGNPITFVEQMRLNATGLGIGGSPQEKLHVWASSGTGIVSDRAVVLSATNNAGGIEFRGGSSASATASLIYARVLSEVVSSTLGSQSGSLVFQVVNLGAGAEAMRITNAGQVGIGVAPSGAALHIKSGGNVPLKLETTTARGSGQIAMALHDPSGQKGYFGYGSANDILQVYNGVGSIDVYASGVQNARVDANGVSGFTANSSAALSAYYRAAPTGSNGGALNFYNWNNSSQDINLARIYCQTTSGSVGNEAGDIYFYTKPSGGALAFRVRVKDIGGVVIAAPSSGVALDVSGVANTATAAFSTGASFGNAANTSTTTLDYYAEGTWTPGLSFGGGTTGWVFSGGGTYVRIGRMVAFSVEIGVSTKGSSTGACLLTGLPFTTDPAGVQQVLAQGGAATEWTSMLTTFSHIAIRTDSTAAGTTMKVFGTSAAAASLTQLTDAAFQNGSNLRFTGIYFTAT